jgi:hypothetical protein
MKNVLPIGNPLSNMKNLFAFTGLIAVGMIFWATLGYLMDMPTLPIRFTLAFISIVLFFSVGILKNRAEKRKFEEFLELKRRDRDMQEKLKDEKIDPGDKTGRAKVKAYYKERNSGLSWSGGSVHGTVPKRTKRRSFLPKNR